MDCWIGVCCDWCIQFCTVIALVNDLFILFKSLWTFLKWTGLLVFVFCLGMRPVRVWAKFRSISVRRGECLTRSCEGIPLLKTVELKVVAMFDHQRAQRVRVLLVRAFPHRLSHCKKLLWRETFTQTKRGVSPRSSDNIKSNYTWIHFFFLICDSKTKSEDEDAVFVQLSSLMWCWKRCIRSSALWLEFGFSGFRA